MTGAKQTLSEFISPAILQHIADGLADKYQLAIVFYDHLGHPVTQPVIPDLTGNDEQNRLQTLLKMILLTPPDIDHLGLQDGKAIYAGFFDGALRRSLVPIVFMQKYLGVCHFIILQPEFMEELKRWAFVLEGFLYDQHSLITFLDSQPLPPSEEMMLITTRLQSQWQRLLESDRQRRFADPIADSEPAGPDRATDSERVGSLITTRSYDVIEADLQAVVMLGYDNADEMVGVNFFSHLVRQARQGAELVEFIENETPMQNYELELVCKSGAPLPISISVLPQNSFLNEPVGFQFLLKDKNAHADQPTESDEEPSTSAADGGGAPPTTPPLTGNLRLQLRDLYSKIKQKSVGSSLGEQGSYPLFVLDPDNLVLVWNDAMQELLHIPSQAILYNPFDQLLLNESQQLWDERMAEFRSHTSQPECAPHEVFSLVDNEGNAVHVRVHLGRNEVMGMELITVTVIETLLPAAEKAAAAPVVEPALPEVRNLEPFISDLHKAPCLTPSADLPRLQEQARIMSRNLEHALLTIFGQPAWTTMVEQTTKKQRSGFLSMQQEIERTFALLRRLQYFSQALPLHRRPVLLHTLIRQSSSMQAHLFSQPVYIRLNLDPQVGLVMADVSLLQQAIDFLCQNALEALQSLGDCLIISTRFDVMPGNEEQPAVEIEIMDNGPGLDERVAGKLFEPFVTTKQEERGYGLGLAATYGIINSHQGVLQIRSGKGLGVAVRILLPAYRNADEQAAAESAVFAFRQNRLVLIVDDDPDLIPMMKKALAGAGFRVLTADTGEKALELVKKNRDALAGAIIDLQLWGMSGIECSKKILQLKRIPIIVSSGLPPMAEAMGVVQSCGGFYLEKPYGMSHLVEIARQMF